MHAKVDEGDDARRGQPDGVGGVDEGDDDDQAVVDGPHRVDAQQTDPDRVGYKDRGYSWVILGAVLADYCLVAIGLGALGVLLPHFIEHFQCSKYEAGWIGSLHMAVGALIGPFMSPALARFGCRPVAMLGGLAGALGYSASYLTRSVAQMYITFGFIAGTGNGMVLLSSSVLLQQYFDRRRTIASALATTGFGLSPLVVAPVTRWMVDTAGWRMAILLLGCVYLQGVAISSLLRPPPKFNKPPIELREIGSSNGRPADDVTDRPPRDLCRIVTSLCRAFNVSLLVDSRFVVFALSTSLSLFGYFAPFVFLPSHAMFGPAAVDSTTAAGLISVLAISMLVGRISSGLIGDRMSSMVCLPASCRKSRERRLFHYAVPMLLAGLANAGVVLWRSGAALTVYSSAVGLLTGTYMVMQQPVLIDLLGLARFAGAFGLFLMINGVASLACQPFAGWLADVSGTYSLPFLVCGLMQASGGLMLIGLGVVRSCRASHSEPIYRPAATCTSESDRQNGH